VARSTVQEMLKRFRDCQLTWPLPAELSEQTLYEKHKWGHPPVGLNLYVASGITKMGITELTVTVWLWLLTMLGFLVVVIYWPPLSTWLPSVLMK
jgi:Tripartite ATP-independent periplasmic transporter, DctM component